MSEYIKRTNRTILFEEFSRFSEKDEDGNPINSVPRLDFILNHDLNISHKAVKDQLTVKSFDEFLSKFTPKYYEYIGSDKDDMPVFTYSIEKPKSNNINYSEHNLEDQPFYKTIMRLYSEKSSSGENNYEFDYKTLTQIMYSPDKAMKDAIDIRDRLVYNYNEFHKLKQKGASPEELQEYGSEVKRLRRLIRDDYMSKSNFNLLPLAIADIQERLDQKGVKNKNKDGEPQRIQPAIVAFTNDGIKAIPKNGKESDITSETPNDRNEVSDDKLIEVNENENDKRKDSPTLRGRLEKDFDIAAQDGKNCLVLKNDQGIDYNENNKIMRELIVSVFSPYTDNTQNTDLDTDKLIEKLNQYQKMYKASQESFSRSVVSLMEKVLNVKAYFDNAGDGAELIISNCSISSLKNNHNFMRFIQAEGSEYSDERIWFAIIPGVYKEEFYDTNSNRYSKTDDADDDLYDDSPEDDNDNNVNLMNMTTLNSLKNALDILGKVNIITFFNFKGCNKTSFSTLNAKIVIDYKKALETVPYSDYAVFCYPNFEILPSRQSSVLIGKNELGNEYIKLPSVYIDASYVAAALYVKSQNKDQLRKHGLRVDDSLEMPVRFDFEIGFDTETDKKVPLSQVFPTNISRELVLSWNEDLKDEINKDGGFGFCFCGDERWVTNNGTTYKQDKIYVYHARTLKIDQDNKRRRPIYKTMVQVYFEKISKKTSYDQMQEYVKDLSNASKQSINHILYSNGTSSLIGEETISIEKDPSTGNYNLTIRYDKDRDSFKLKFNETTAE